MPQPRNALKIGDRPLVTGDLTLVAMGGNLPSECGPPSKTLAAAVGQFECYGLHLKALSAFYETPCFPAGTGPDYVNAAAIVVTDMDALGVLAALNAIELQFGRERTRRWGRRTLDLDLVAMGDKIAPDRATHDSWRNLPAGEQATTTPDQLVLPHPRVQDRGFVLVPLADIAAAWVHPVLNLSVSQMLAALPDSARQEVKRL
jgi:2-amino-4-hydroxy-6-hydroxymethyldihydropteridine diphosphokinase